MRRLLALPEWLADLLGSLAGSVVCTLYVGKPVGVWYSPDYVRWSERWLSPDDRELVQQLMDWVHDGRTPGLVVHRAVGRAAVRLVVAVTVVIGLVAMLSRCLGGPVPERLPGSR